uniref:Uncharacterized protein n=1 Tax=Arundo donax TaxID=35708 RepID=A0A0A9C4U3_ARUDO
MTLWLAPRHFLSLVHIICKFLFISEKGNTSVILTYLALRV